MFLPAEAGAPILQVGVSEYLERDIALGSNTVSLRYHYGNLPQWYRNDTAMVKRFHQAKCSGKRKGKEKLDKKVKCHK